MTAATGLTATNLAALAEYGAHPVNVFAFVVIGSVLLGREAWRVLGELR